MFVLKTYDSLRKSLNTSVWFQINSLYIFYFQKIHTILENWYFWNFKYYGEKIINLLFELLKRLIIRNSKLYVHS